MNTRNTILCTIICLLPATIATAQIPQKPPMLPDEGLTQRQGEWLPLSLSFTDERGFQIRLDQIIRSDIPVLLTLNYYACATQCSIHLQGLATLIPELQRSGMQLGRDYRILTISIADEEDARLARAAKQRMVELSAMPSEVGQHWHMLTGDRKNIDLVCQAVGYSYQYDPITRQYAHPSVTIFLSPRGQISQYIPGLNLRTQDFRLALIDAGEGRIGSFLDQFIANCYRFDPQKGQYTPFAMGIMKVGGMVTLACMGLFLSVLWFTTRARRAHGQPAPTGTDSESTTAGDPAMPQDPTDSAPPRGNNH